MSRQVIVPPTGLLPHRPYSPAVLAGNLLYVSGHTGSDPRTREFEAGIARQAEARAKAERGAGTVPTTSLASAPVSTPAPVAREASTAAPVSTAAT